MRGKGAQGELFAANDRHRRRGTNARALGTTVAAMRAGGLLEPADEALVVGARTAALMLDAALGDRDESRYTLARLGSEYRAWLDMLRALAPAGGAGLEELFDAFDDDPTL